MEVLYLLTNPAKPEECHLPDSARFGAVFTDIVGHEQTALHACLDSLQDGDTLYVARERHLCRDFGKAIELMGNLARRGVNIWLGRTGQFLDCKTSPFLELKPEAADAIVNFSKTFTLRKAMQGFQKARSAGVRPGRQAKPLPRGFEEARAAWQAGKITQKEAAGRCGMSLSTFRKKACL